MCVAERGSTLVTGKATGSSDEGSFDSSIPRVTRGRMQNMEGVGLGAWTVVVGRL